MKVSTEDRFWSKVDKSGGPDSCWLWTACRDRDGYGQSWDGRKQVGAHRFAYELTHGPILEGLCACHRCDNPPCCNPAHMFLGTNADNMADRNTKGRQAMRGRNGNYTHPERRPKGGRHGMAKLTEANVAEIRADYASGRVTQKEIGRRFGVSKQLICQIIHKKIWKTDGNQLPDMEVAGS